MRPYIFWPWSSGLAFLAIGLMLARRDLLSARGLEKLVAAGPVFMAASFAAFAAEHFTLTSFIRNDIPAWIPARGFLAYFVGVALYAAATSLVARRLVWLSGSLFAAMMVLFTATMHVPSALHGADRFPWIVAFRDLSFGAGALALAGADTGGWRAGRANPLVTIGRLVVSVALLIFGVEHLLHPLNAPGVPLQKMTPPWIPLPAVWGYVTGAIELVAGGLMMADRGARAAAAWMGLVVTLLVVIIYLPFAAVAVDGGQKLEALNYIWDTLLFAGGLLAVAGSARRSV